MKKKEEDTMKNYGAAYLRKKETQYYQKMSAKAGTFSPRGLARSVARATNRKNSGKESDLCMWRSTIRTEWARMKNVPKRVLRKLTKEG